MTDRSFNTECPVCMDAMFDENGVADRDVAEIMCLHLIHSDCLAAAGRALNADGQRYGIGGFGARAGCPICQEPVSNWMCYSDAGCFKAFWTTKIENALRKIGPRVDGNCKEPIDCQLLCDELNCDTSLTEAQKKMIQKPSPTDYDYGLESSGFLKSLEHAGRVDYSLHDYYCAPFLKTRGIWHYDRRGDSVWLWEWGLCKPASCCSHCNTQAERLKVCTGCKDSLEASMYCNKTCQRADWSKHKVMCKIFQTMKQGGTKEQIRQRMDELRQELGTLRAYNRN